MSAEMINRAIVLRIRFYCCILMVMGWLSTSALQAQVTKETYKKAEYFLSGNLQKEVFRLEVIPNWLEDTDAFWHVTNTRNGKRFFITDIAGKNTLEVFDHEVLADLLQEKTGEQIDSRNLPFERIEIRKDSVIAFEWKNRNWTFDNKNGVLTSSVKERQADRTGISPDKKWRAFTRDFNLFVENLETAEEIQLSYAGKREFEYGTSYGWGDIIKGENGIRPERFFLTWSPDSRKILSQIVDFRRAEKMYLLDFSKDEKFRPELLSYYRGSPGDTTVVYNIPVVFDVEKRRETVLSELVRPHFMSASLKWDETGAALSGGEMVGATLSGMVFQRGYKQLDYVRVDAESGSIRKLFSDRSETFVESTYHFQDLQNGQFIVSSEKTGWKHLYLYDGNSGELIRPLTSGDFVVTRLHHIDKEKQWVYFEASGREKGRNVYYPHLYKVRMDGTGLTLLTREDAYHDIHISRDKKFFTDNYSRADHPTKSVLKDLETGDIIMEISEADISNLLERGYQSPRHFSAIAKDGKTEIYGLYYLPTNFDASKKYPVIDYTYTGPFTAVTPKSFRDALVGHQQAMAELGFVVVTIDGTGTSGRGKAFQDVSYRNLGDGTTDHVLAIKQLAESVPFLDIERVGIFGHSAGGYDAARAMLLHPDFYKVGVASAGDHDHRMEKAWWPEMYMGYPVGEFYHEQSNVTNASGLKGRLLLAHGAIDENVNPSATYKLAEALIKAGKDFDLFIWPGKSHSFGRPAGDYFTKKRWDYFIQHLLGEEPILHYQPN